MANSRQDIENILAVFDRGHVGKTLKKSTQDRSVKIVPDKYISAPALTCAIMSTDIQLANPCLAGVKERRIKDQLSLT